MVYFMENPSKTPKYSRKAPSKDGRDSKPMLELYVADIDTSSRLGLYMVTWRHSNMIHLLTIIGRLEKHFPLVKKIHGNLSIPLER